MFSPPLTYKDVLDLQDSLQREQLPEPPTLGETTQLAQSLTAIQALDGAVEGVRRFLGDLKNRWYHNIRHALAVQNSFEKNGDVGTALFAAYHDCVYRVGLPGESEALSADALAADWILRPTVNPVIIMVVLRAIVATADHVRDQPYLSRHARDMLDADLAELADPQKYWINAELIRREYNAFGVRPENFVAGRKLFLDKMLARQSIFYADDPKHSKMEISARNNMRLEREALSAS